MKPDEIPTPSLRDLGYIEDAELATMVAAKTLTLANWRAKGIGPPFTKVHGNRVVYPLDGVKKWLQSRTVNVRSTPTLKDGPSKSRRT